MDPRDRRTVLVIEDDPDIAEAIQEVLEEVFAVQCADNASTAIAGLRHRPPDLVLVDCSLASDRLRNALEQVDCSATATILMSGDVELVLMFAALLGCPFLHKPFGSRDLWTVIGHALGDRTGRAQGSGNRRLGTVTH